jgi:uncharacterized protein YecT (DUF1311 family)
MAAMSAWLRRSLGPFIIVATLSLVGRVGRAGDAPAEPWKASCARVKDVAFPAADQPDDGARKALHGCSSESLFYGIGQAADPEKARLCAYVERAAGDDLVFGGSAILMTIYATGVGGQRNPDLAIHLACGLEGAPAEMEYRVKHLETLKTKVTTTAKASKTSKTGKPIKFDLCDDISSGFMEGHCASHDQRITQAKRDQKYAARLAKWTPPERAAFQKLRDAAGLFFVASSGNEVDMSGTARAQIQIEEEEALEKSFSGFLDRLERGAVPAATAAELAKADRQLNAVYQKVMHAGELGAGTVTADGIRQTERTWPGYRDAWAELARVKFPQTDPVAVKVWLTQARRDMLESFVPSNDKEATKK